MGLEDAFPWSGHEVVTQKLRESEGENVRIKFIVHECLLLAERSSDYCRNRLQLHEKHITEDNKSEAQMDYAITFTLLWQAYIMYGYYVDIVGVF